MITSAMLATLIYGELTALGANGAFLSVAAAMAQIVLGMAVLLHLPLDQRFWRGSRVGLSLALFTIAFAFLPTLGNSLPAMASARAQWLTPDLAGAGLARAGGAWAMLLTGAAIGYQRGGSRRFLDAMLIGAALYLPFALFLWQFAPHTVWGLPKGINTDRFTGTMLNANASGCVFAVIALLGFALWCSLIVTGSRRWGDVGRIGLALLVLGALGACAVTGSRTALSLCALALVVQAAKAWGGGLSRRGLSRRGLALGGLVALMGAIVVLVGSATFDRVGSAVGDFGGRLAIWSYYLEIARDAPIFGYGTGAFASANLLHMTRPEFFQFWYIAAAHNFALGVLIEHGWVVLLLEALVVATIAATIAKSRVGGHGVQIKLAMVLALLLILGCASVDIALDVPAVSALALALLGLLWGQAIRQRGADGRRA